jgi:hypothetical protein
MIRARHIKFRVEIGPNMSIFVIFETLSVVGVRITPQKLRYPLTELQGFISQKTVALRPHFFIYFFFHTCKQKESKLLFL